ncbi:MAG TPA: cytochrome c oxidase assembly protein [Methylomirabilota bacterium]
MRPEILAPLALSAVLYAVGWWRLRRRAPEHVGPARALLALVAWVSIGAALLSPLDRLAHALFVAHMAQHMLLIVVAAPALLLADPFPVMVWGLPQAVRRTTPRWLRREALLGRLWRALTPLSLAWLLYALVLWLWHLPLAYDSALGDRLLHDVQHVSFFAAAILFWWPVIDPAPHFRASAPYGRRIVYLLLAAFQTAGLGLLLTLSPWVLYPSYAVAPQRGGLSPADDQIWGGIVMWGVGGMIDMLAVLILIWRFLAAEPPRVTAPN